MRIAIIDTYYPRFLAAHYRWKLGLSHTSFENQRQRLLDTCFGTSDFYSRHLNQLGCEAQDLIVNCVPLQKRWAQENNVSMSTLAMRAPHRMLRWPVIGPWFSSLPGLLEVAIAQVKRYKPDVLYCQDLSFFPGDVLKQLKSDVGLIVGQIACPLPSDSFLTNFDLILTSFPHFIPRLCAMGIATEYFRIGFDERVLTLVGEVSRDIEASFVGGISQHHGNALPLLAGMASQTSMRFFGYGAGSLPSSSLVRQRHGGEVWGLDMYRTLARSRVTLNRHIDVAERYANNMRLYEATGMGAMLLTDRKDNLNDLFNVGKEVVAYESIDEACEMVRHYVAHPKEAAAIAQAGQSRTLREHTYGQRMAELVPILKRHFKARQ